jgi:hypothetical protein
MRGALLRGRDLRQRPHDAVHNVVYVCKVALQLALLWPLQRNNPRFKAEWVGFGGDRQGKQAILLLAPSRQPTRRQRRKRSRTWNMVMGLPRMMLIANL